VTRPQNFGPTITLLNPKGSPQALASSNAASFTLPTQTLSAGTYTVVVDPSGTNTGNITVAVTNP